MTKLPRTPYSMCQVHGDVSWRAPPGSSKQLLPNGCSNTLANHTSCPFLNTFEYSKRGRRGWRPFSSFSLGSGANHAYWWF